MELLDLPSEILILVWDHVSPPDIPSFACLSKRVHELGQQALAQHHDYLKTWSVLSLGGREGYTRTPVDVLNTLLDHRRLCHYIRIISYAPHLGRVAKSRPTGTVMYKETGDAAMQRLETALSKVTGQFQAGAKFRNTRAEAITSRLRSQLDDFKTREEAGPVYRSELSLPVRMQELAAYMVITLAQHVTALRLRVTSSGLLALGDALKLYATYERASPLSTLQRLEYFVHPEGNPSTSVGDMHLSTLFDQGHLWLALKKVALVCTCIGWTEDPPSQTIASCPRAWGSLPVLSACPVEELCLKHCNVGPWSLEWLLGGMVNLRMLRYVHGDLSQSDGRWSASAIFKSLELVVGSTLSHLSFYIPDMSPNDSCTPIVSLRGFTSLRRFEGQYAVFGDHRDGTDDDMFCCSYLTQMPDHNKGPPFAEVLPISIEHVSLEVHTAADNLSDLVDMLELRKNERLPNLKTVGIASRDVRAESAFNPDDSRVAYAWIGDKLEADSW